MESNKIKYTKDGKKVVVIGDLNQTDKIVQEVFVTKDGDEIPQGERFVERNLLDEPAKSWKESELEKLEAKYERDRKEWNSKIDKLNQEKRLAYDSLSARVKWLRNMSKEPRQEELKTVINQIADFLDGSNKYVFISDYSDWRLESFDKESIDSLLDSYDGGYGRRRFNEMRLLSLYGRSDGSLVYKINTYSDGSGSDKDVEFFKSKEDAMMYLQNRFDSLKEYSSYSIEIAEKYDLKLDEEKMEAYLNARKESIEKQLEEVEKRKINLLNDLNSISAI